MVVNAGKVNNLLEVKFTLKNPNIPSGTGTRSGNVDVEMEVKKLNSAVVLRKTVQETIPLLVEVDGTGKLFNCRSTLDSKALSIKSDAKQEMCTSLGGTWNSGTQRCSVMNLFKEDCEKMTGTTGSTSAWDATTKACSLDNLLNPMRAATTSVLKRFEHP